MVLAAGHAAAACLVRAGADRHSGSRPAVKGAIAAVAAWVLPRYAVRVSPIPTSRRSRPFWACTRRWLARCARALVTWPGSCSALRWRFRSACCWDRQIAGIAVVVVAGVLVSGWRRLGDQSAQVTFTALFALLLGGHQPFHYVAHRMVDVGIGVVTGLVVNVLVFPPLQSSAPAEHAIRQWGEDIAGALEDLSRARSPIRGLRPAVVGLARAPAHYGGGAGPRGGPRMLETACGGTRGPGPSNPYRSRTARCSIPSRCSPPGPVRSPGRGRYHGRDEPGRSQALDSARTDAHDAAERSPIPSGSRPTTIEPGPAPAPARLLRMP